MNSSSSTARTWRGLAQKLKSRFQAKAPLRRRRRPCLALDYEPWRARGIKTHASRPKEYVIGYVNSVCDGGGLATVTKAWNTPKGFVTDG